MFRRNANMEFQRAMPVQLAQSNSRSRITANDYEHSLTGMAHSRLTLQSGIVMEDSNSNLGLGDLTQN